ncbi:MAG: DUF423 domain-containing protein [Pseudomonadota bacterium]
MLTVLAAIAGFVAVALGAFGAHGLEGQLSSEQVSWWTTASFYLLTHAAAALAVGLSDRTGLIRHGGYALVLGAFVFAATLYAMALGAPRWLGAVTPIGGLAMLFGWALIAWAGRHSSPSR